MPTPSIPGYYYDAPKKKYFKILPNHVAPAGFKYSEESLKREAGDQVSRKRHKAYDLRRLQTTIDLPRRRSHLLGGGVGLGREMGESFDGGRAAWAQLLVRRSLGTARGSSALFAYDDATGGLILAGTQVSEGMGERQDVLAWVSIPYAFMPCALLRPWRLMWW